MSHDLTEYLGFLRPRASLRLMWYINIARRVPADKVTTEWPAPHCDLPEPWQGRWKDIKHLVRTYSIRHSHPLEGVVNKDTTVEPLEFLKCVEARGPIWEWLREVCELWVAATGINTSRATSDAFEDRQRPVMARTAIESAIREYKANDPRPTCLGAEKLLAGKAPRDEIRTLWAKIAGKRPRGRPGKLTD